jgi:RecA/RadA recombinase
MAKEKEVSLADKVRNRLNESSDKEGGIVKSFDVDDEMLQVKSWIPLKEFFRLATGGPGFPCGHITQVIGAPDSGKTSLVMEGMVSCQKLGGVAYLIDAEHKFSMQRFALMGGTPKDVLVIPTDTLEEVWTAIDFVLKETQTLREEGVTAPMMLVWDSVAASVPEKMIDSEAGDAHISLEAKLNNKNVRRLRQAIKKTELACVFINHFYMTMPKTMYEQSKLVVKGGEEMSFMSTLILLTKQGAKIERDINKEKQQIGRMTKYTVHKGHFHGRTIAKEVRVVDIGILETDEEFEKYKKTLKGDI